MLVETMLAKARERLATINAESSLKEAADRMSQPHTDLLIVCGHDGSMVGVLTKTDIVAQLGQCNGDYCTIKVARMMTRKVIACQPTEVLHDVWLLMEKRGLQRIPVVDTGGTPMGIVYARDALQQLLSQSEFDENQLRHYIMGVGYG